MVEPRKNDKGKWVVPDEYASDRPRQAKAQAAHRSARRRQSLGVGAAGTIGMASGLGAAYGSDKAGKALRDKAGRMANPAGRNASPAPESRQITGKSPSLARRVKAKIPVSPKAMARAGGALSSRKTGRNLGLVTGAAAMLGSAAAGSAAAERKREHARQLATYRVNKAFEDYERGPALHEGYGQGGRGFYDRESRRMRARDLGGTAASIGVGTGAGLSYAARLMGKPTASERMAQRLGDYAQSDRLVERFPQRPDNPLINRASTAARRGIPRVARAAQTLTRPKVAIPAMAGAVAGTSVYSGYHNANDRLLTTGQQQYSSTPFNSPVLRRASRGPVSKARVAIPGKIARRVRRNAPTTSDLVAAGQDVKDKLDWREEQVTKAVGAPIARRVTSLGAGMKPPTAPQPRRTSRGMLKPKTSTTMRTPTMGTGAQRQTFPKMG